MELDLWALVAVAVGIVPGIPGEMLYRLIAGGTWREDTWARVFRIVGFSLAGLVLTILTYRAAGVCTLSDLSKAASIGTLDELVILDLAALLGGQTVAGTFVGVGIAFLARAVSSIFRMTPYVDAWDEFIRNFVQGHWVIARLLDGTSLAGVLARGDITVPPENRDIILSEPAIYERESGNYCSLSYQHLFIPGASLASVAVVHDPETDSRVSPIGVALFQEEIADEQAKG